MAAACRDATPQKASKGDNLCERCTAKCCRYIALPIDEPKTRDDFDYIRWYLTHQDVSVFVESGDWYIMMQRECQYLLPDHRCGIYLQRPRICREYSTDECEFDDEYTYEKIFEHDSQIWEYAEAVLGQELIDPRTGEILG